MAARSSDSAKAKRNRNSRRLDCAPEGEANSPSGSRSVPRIPPCTVLIFAFAPGGGSFVIGDKNTAKQHGRHLLGFPVGEAELPERRASTRLLQGLRQEPNHTDMWDSMEHRTRQQHPTPKGPLPAYMGVIGTSLTSQSGSQISGDTKLILVVKTYPGYENDPGHAGTATVVTTACP
jgi:hypothetical protein